MTDYFSTPGGCNANANGGAGGGGGWIMTPGGRKGSSGSRGGGGGGGGGGPHFRHTEQVSEGFTKPNVKIYAF